MVVRMAIVRSAPFRRALAVVACLDWLAASACTLPRPADKSPRQPAGERVEEPTEPPLPSGSTRASVSTEGKQANGESSTPVLSGTGRYVAFESAASNLVSDDKNGSGDVFFHLDASGGAHVTMDELLAERHRARLD